MLLSYIFFDGAEDQKPFLDLKRAGHNRLTLGGDLRLHDKKAGVFDPDLPPNTVLKVSDQNSVQKFPSNPVQEGVLLDRLASDLASFAISHGYTGVYLASANEKLQSERFINLLAENLRALGATLFVEEALAALCETKVGVVPVMRYDLDAYFLRSMLYDFSKAHASFSGLCLDTEIFSDLVPLKPRDFVSKQVKSHGIEALLSERGIKTFFDDARMTNYFTFLDQDKSCNLFFKDDEASLKARLSAAFDYGFTHAFFSANSLLRTVSEDGALLSIANL